MYGDTPWGAAQDRLLGPREWSVRRHTRVVRPADLTNRQDGVLPTPPPGPADRTRAGWAALMDLPQPGDWDPLPEDEGWVR